MPELPPTGSDAFPIAGLGAALVIVGALFLAFERRRLLVTTRNSEWE